MRTTVRWRTTLGAVAVVGLALAAGSVVLVAALRGTVRNQVESAADLRAEDIVALSRDTRLGVLAVEDGEDGGVQVRARDGTVLAASTNLADPRALPDVPVGHSRAVDRLSLGDGAYLVVSRSGDDGARVLVARSLEPVGEATRAVVTALLAGVPLIMLVVGVTTWLVTGRALRPVELIRNEVDTISARDLSRRVPSPSGDDEVARLARTMNAMLDRLEASASRQRRFVSDASHELRSPLAAIRHQLEVAAADPEGVRLDELLPSLLADDLRLESLVSDLLLLARADEGHLAVRRLVDLDDLLHAQATRATAPGGPTIDMAGVQPVQVRGDPAALERLVGNLVGNAVRHASSRVTLGLTTTQSQALLSVEDDGAGIPDADRERVFERFARLDEGRARDAGGSGLGLAVVSEVARAHGGAASVAGARFTVRLSLTGDAPQPEQD